MLNKHISNIIIGKPIVEDWELLALDKEDWERKERFETIWIEERFLPNILTTEIKVKHFDEIEKVFKEDTMNLNVFTSKSMLRKNRPDLVRNLDHLDFEMIKIGKKRFWLLIGE